MCTYFCNGLLGPDVVIHAYPAQLVTPPDS